ncbi:VWA domain-containing protein [Chryseobacterium ginsenosidimutans]|uniref:VWA domain-containing protein n=1 Tax=Chryseobacterium ginsenosidimutans TaxID=687846 RepID=UPI0031D45012
MKIASTTSGLKISKSKTKGKKVKTNEEFPEAGKLTAGEVNDFSKWNYWQDMAIPVLSDYKNQWKFFPDKRISVQLVNKNKKPVIGKKLKLLNDKKEIIWEAVSDNKGNAELWIAPRTDYQSLSKKYSITDEKGNTLSANANLFKKGQNIITIDAPCLQKRNLDLVFVVDATGSMGDEISYLQAELLDVLQKVEKKLQNTTDVRYGSVFYRDHGDEYVTKEFNFSNKAENLVDFIKKQSAGGGGDTPEAVVEALDSSIDKLSWSKGNSTKIMFLILDASPHYSEENIDKIYKKIKLAAQKGITIIPLAASDTDKQTEYIMRTFALLTNGTYTFLTNHSGIGNNHIEPTTDSYEVEKLNDLLLRLILQRSTIPSCQSSSNNKYINKKIEVEIENEENPKVKIYPNPTKGLINIQSNKPIDELYLYDFSGKILIRKEKLLKGTSKIDITSYPQSVYLMRCKYGKQWDTFKIIKN